MAATVDLTVYPNLSPVVIEVDAPQTDITAQDFYDSVKAWEDTPIGILYPKLISAGGKEDLGGGVLVGITATLINARIRFAARADPLDAGYAATAADVTGEHLTAASGLFVTRGVYPGCTVFNVTTGSMESVIEVISETELTMFPLKGGTRQDWRVGDQVAVYPNVQCSITGGNLVAIDETGTTIDVVYQSPNVQVIMTSSSSATLTEQSVVRYSSFQNAVWFDPNTSYEGIEYPVGNHQFPVNNWDDAVEICAQWGFTTVQILDSTVIGMTTDIIGFRLVGKSHVLTEVEIEGSAQCEDVTIENCYISGVLDGGTHIKDCTVGDLTYVNGHIHNSGIAGVIYLDGNENAVIANCFTVDQDFPAIIDMGGSGQELAVPNFSGLIEIRNLTDAVGKVGIGLLAGMVQVDSSVTAGIFIVSGIGLLINNGTPSYLNTDGLMSKQTVTEIIWDTVYYDAVGGEAGTAFPVGTSTHPSNNIANVKLIAEANKLKKISINGTVMITDDFIGYAFFGAKSALTDVIILTGRDMTGSRFELLSVAGALGGSDHQFMQCVTQNLSGIDSIFVDCGMSGSLTLATDGQFLVKSSVFMSLPSIIDFGNSASSAAMQIDSGNVKIINMDDASCLCQMTMASGHCELDPSCVTGTVTNRGHNTLDDFSGPACVVVNDNYFIDIIKTTWDEINVDTDGGVDSDVFPAGTPGQPCKTEANLISIRTHNPSINRIHIDGSLTLTAAYVGFVFDADSETTGAVDINGQDIRNTKFQNIYLTGSPVSGCHIHADNCYLPSGMSNVDCHMENCQLFGTFVVDAGGAMQTDRCTASDPTGTILNCNGDGAVTMANCGGIWVITNATSPAAVIGITGTYLLTLDSSITAGIFNTGGIGRIYDNSTSKTLHIDATIPGATWDEVLTSGHDVTGSAAVMINTMNDGQSRLLGLSHENAFMDNIVNDESEIPQLKEARLRCFDSAANAAAATAGGSETTGLVATYTIDAEYEGLNLPLTQYRMTLNP